MQILERLFPKKVPSIEKEYVQLKFDREVKLALEKAQSLAQKYNLSNEDPKGLDTITSVEKPHWSDGHEYKCRAILSVPPKLFVQLFTEYHKKSLSEQSAYPAGNSGGFEPRYLWFTIKPLLRIITEMEITEDFYKNIVYPSYQSQNNTKKNYSYFDYVSDDNAEKVKILPTLIAKK